MSHVGFYLYDCGENHSHLSQHYVKLVVNEMEVSLPGFSIYCPYAEFWSQFKNHLSETFQSLCARYESVLPSPKPVLATRNNEHPTQDDNPGSFFELYVVLVLFAGIFMGLLFSRINKILCTNNRCRVFFREPHSL